MANLRCWQILSAVLLVTTLALLGAVVYLTVDKHGQAKTTKQTESLAANCHPTLPPNTRRSSDRGGILFSPLTDEEFNSITQYMLRQPALALTDIADAALSSNYIFSIDLSLPRKADVLSYLDANGNLERQALVTLHLGSKNPPVVEEYIVSPTMNPTRHKMYNSTIRRYPIPWNVRAHDHLESAAMAKQLDIVTAKIDFIMKESFNFTFHNCTTQCLHSTWPTPMATKSGERTSWVVIERDRSPLTEGFHLHQVPVFFRIDHGGTDPSKFKVDKVWYNNVEYDSAEELIQSYRNPANRIKIPMPDAGATYGSPERRIPENDMEDHLRAPDQVQPNGLRFDIDGNKITYLGWSFYVRFPRVSGPQLLDVRYHGERILYEASLQDIGVLYSGKPPTGFFMEFFDTSWQTGLRYFSLIRGVDCPNGAQYLDHSPYNTETARGDFRKDAMCVFELNTGLPLRRHFSGDFSGPEPRKYSFAFSMPDTVLIVRAIATIWNYDYIIDFIFHQNGALEARVSPTGYMFLSTLSEPNPTQNIYAVPINQKLKIEAPIHHHIFCLKLDADILGTENRFKTLDLTSQYVTGADSYYPPGTKYAMTRYDHRMKSSEQEALVHYDFDKPKYYIVYNENEAHANGNKRGYKITPNGFSKMLLPTDSPPAKAASYFRNQMAVTVEKEYEQSTAFLFRQFDVLDPIQTFDKFYEDNENIVDKDLVLWVTLGLQHIPCAEDVPVPTTPGKILSVLFSPYNYFSDDPSFRSRDGVVVRMDEKTRAGKVTSYFDEKKDKQCTASRPKVGLNLGF